MSEQTERAVCSICGEPMPEGEGMFKFHGYSGPCPKPALPKKPTPTVDQLLRCINMAMGCLDPLSRNVDERLAWYRLHDALEGREPRAAISEAS